MDKKKRLLHFTKKVGKIAGDVAFGPDVTDEGGDEEGMKTPKYNDNNSYYVDNDKINNNMTLQNIIKVSKIHSMEFYLDYLRFFLKYMDDADIADCLNFAITRNSLWFKWYSLMLERTLDILENDGYDLPDTVPMKKSESRIMSKKTAVNISNELPEISVEAIDKETFQDRRIILLLLWHKQILNKLFNRKELIMEKLSNVPLHPITPQITIITKNKLKSYKPSKLMNFLIKGQLAPSSLELLDGWQFRHDFPNFKINLISIVDRYQIITDLANTFHPIDEESQDALLNRFKFLTSEFIASQMDKNELKFIEDYSSFGSPNAYSMPLKTNSQNLVFITEFSCTVKTELDVRKAMAEYKRILNPVTGSLILTFLDTIPSINPTAASLSVHEYVQYLISSKFCNNKIPSLNTTVINELKNSKFKNIKFVKLSIPIIIQNKSTAKNGRKIEDDMILSMFAMKSSFIDLLRIDSKVDLHNIKDSTPDHHDLKLWIDWRLNGLNGKLVQEFLSLRKKTHFLHNDYTEENPFACDYDTELNLRVNFDKQSDFVDGFIAGYEYVWIVTADA